MLTRTLSRSQKRILIVVTDIFLVTLSLWLAYTLRLGRWFWPSQVQLFILLLTPVLAIPIFNFFELYQEVIRYIGHRGMLAIVRAAGAVAFFWFLTTTAFFFFYFDIEITSPLLLGSEIIFPRSVPIIFGMILVLTLGGSRQAARWLLINASGNPTPQAKKNVLIYGAGGTGIELASSLSQNTGIKVLGIIDDDKS